MKKQKKPVNAESLKKYLFIILAINTAALLVLLLLQWDVLTMPSIIVIGVAEIANLICTFFIRDKTKRT